MHCFDILLCLINVTGGLDRKLYMECLAKCCNSNCVCYLSLFEIGMLVFMQMTYVKAQDAGCMSGAPDLYFWMMGQILIQYIGLAFVLSYFLRKLENFISAEEVSWFSVDFSLNALLVASWACPGVSGVLVDGSGRSSRPWDAQVEHPSGHSGDLRNGPLQEGCVRRHVRPFL